MSTLRDKRVLVLGLGESGLAMARWCARQGAEVRIADTREAPPLLARAAELLPNVPVDLGHQNENLLDQIDLVAVSPGLDPRSGLIAAARRRGLRITGEMALFAEALQASGERERCRILAITGTNGKTTTTALTAALARSAGLDAVAAGNISPGALDVLMDRLDNSSALPRCWVLELSSFQLETAQGLDADAATILNVSDDHLDRYDSFDDYVRTKTRIFDGNGAQVLNRDDARVAAMARPGRFHIGFGLNPPPRPEDYGLVEQQNQFRLFKGERPLLALDELPIGGLHNAANAMAALALCEAGLGLAPEALLDGLRAFKGLPHRVELVAARADGVLYYDDSKGTNVGATIAALQGMGRKVVLIAGGDGKGQDFRPLALALAQHARAVVLIGRDAAAIEAAVAGNGVPLEHAADLPAAVRRADALARPQDAVMLSPACASMDMFRDYAHRAEVFVAAVRNLPEVEAR